VLPASEGVGEGDMTRGVCGIWYWREDSMAARQQVGKYGSGGVRMTPERRERTLETSNATLARRLGFSGTLERMLL
jgi:hypothetical protein